MFDKSVASKIVNWDELQVFLATHAGSSAFLKERGGFLSLQEKESVIGSLVEYLSTSDFSNAANLVFALDALRILVREPPGCGQLFASKTLQRLCELSGFKDAQPSRAITLAARKCLINCLHVSSEARESFTNLDGSSLLVETLLTTEYDDYDALFLLLRCLFLLTGHDANAAELVAATPGLGNKLEKIIQPIVDRCNTGPLLPAANLVFEEILKLGFNITLDRRIAAQPTGGLGGIIGSSSSSAASISGSTLNGDKVSSKLRSVAGLESLLGMVAKLLVRLPFNSSRPLESPRNHAINLLLNYPVTGNLLASWQNEEQSRSLATVLTDTLKCSMEIVMPYTADAGLVGYEKGAGSIMFGNATPDEAITPITMVLSEMCRGDKNIRKTIRLRLAPDNIDRTKTIDNANTVTSRLIRMMTSAIFENLKHGVSELLYCLFDEDATKMVQYVGYGNAAGFLLNQGIMFNPATASSNSVPAAPSEGNSQGSGERLDINPITGNVQRDREKLREEWEKLSDAEKEAEAEKLVKLIDQLNKSGIIRTAAPFGGGLD